MALQIAWWLAAAALALPTLVVVPQALDAFRLPQRMLAEWLALASLVALSLTRGRSAGAPGAALWRQPGAAAVAPLLLVAAAGLLTTAHRVHVAEALVDLGIGAAALAGWAWGFSAPRLRRLLDVAALAALPTASIAVLQAHHLWQPVLFAVDPGGERLEITSMAGNPGDLAALLVLPALVCQANLVRVAGRWRWAWLAALLVNVYALAATRTLTSLAALAAGSALLWLLALPPRRAALATAAAVAGLALLVAAVPPLRERVLAQGEVVRRGDLDALLTGRLDGWRVAARLLAEHPLAGVGHGAYRAEFLRTKLAMASEGQTFFVGHQRPSFANVHNEYLETAAELGWPGLLALAWGVALLVLAARRGWRARERHDAALGWAGLGAIAVLALAYFPFRLGPVAFARVAFFAGMLGAEGEGAER